MRFIRVFDLTCAKYAKKNTKCAKMFKFAFCSQGYGGGAWAGDRALPGVVLLELKDI